MDDITYPCWNQSQSILVKGVPETQPKVTSCKISFAHVLLLMGGFKY